MKDLYPTRKTNKGRFIKRSCLVSHTDNYKSYTINGFFLIKNFFEKNQIERLLSANATGMVTLEPGLKEVRAVSGFHHQEPFKSIVSDKRLTKMVSEILGGGVYVHQSRINYKKAFSGSGWSWHSDFETWNSQDGMPLMRCLTAMIPLTENTECNGSLMVVPKSQDIFYSCPKGNNTGAENEFADQKEGVPDTDALKIFFENSNHEIEMIKCSPGDLVLFDCNLLHVSTSNLTSKDRTNMFIVYNSVENMLTNPKRPEELGATKINEIYY